MEFEDRVPENEELIPETSDEEVTDLEQTEETDEQEEETEQEPAQSEKDKFLKAIKDKHPDLDEEGLYRHANESYRNKKQSLEDMNTTAGEILDIIADNPDAAEFLQAISETGDPAEGLLIFPEDVLEDALEMKRNGGISDEDKRKKIDEHKNNVLSRRNFKQTLKENEPKSLKAIEDFAKDRKISPDKVVEKVIPILQNINENNITKEMLQMFFSEELQKEAYDKGVIDGKNSKTENVRLQKKSSGLPQPKAESATLEPKKNNGNPFAFMTGE